MSDGMYFQSFTPQLLDLFAPAEELSSSDIQNIFVVM
jgi:hypothetical protein